MLAAVASSPSRRVCGRATASSSTTARRGRPSGRPQFPAGRPIPDAKKRRLVLAGQLVSPHAAVVLVPPPRQGWSRSGGWLPTGCA